jgi:hypothetical protein
VSVLPHTRYDQFKEKVDEYEEMGRHTNIKDCPCATFRDISGGDYSISDELKEEARLVCSWPNFHSDLATLKETGKILHVVQGQLVSDPLKDTRMGRKHRDSFKLLDEDDIVQAVERRAADMVEHVTSRLEDKVYSEEDQENIGHTRVLLGAHSLLLGANSRGAATSANLTIDKFYSSALAVDCNVLDRVTEEQFRSQYREYVRRLEALAADPENRKLSDMCLVKLFTNPDRKDLYQDIEAIVSVMVRAALLISVESVVENWISVMEHHASQRRTLGEMKLYEEMCIAVNGPSLVHCDSIVQVRFDTNEKLLIRIVY